jgi:hypothetical protein
MPFDEAIAQTSRADLTVFGLSQEPNLKVVQELSQKITGSSIFVRGFGQESILA